MANEKKKAHRLRKILLILLCVWMVLNAAGTAVYFAVGYGRYDKGTAVSESMLPADETFRFRSGKSDLQAFLWKAEGDEPAKGVVLLLHGSHGRASYLTDAAGALIRAGWDVISFDGTGTGESTGSGVKSLQQMAEDGRAALSAVRAMIDADCPVVLWGHSAGGWAAAVLSHEEGVSGVICVNAFETVSGIMIDTAQKYAGPVVYTGAPFIFGGLFLQNNTLAFEKASDALLTSGHPVLVLQSAEDQTVPRASSLYQALADSGSETVTLSLREGTQHSDHLTAEDGVLTDEVTAFLAQVLQDRTAQ